MENKPTIIFIIGMHRSGTSLLSNCLVENGFSIGKTKNKDKDWQNPNGYFENDVFTEMHDKMLHYNNSSWNKITVNKMKYTVEHLKKYRNLLKKEFNNENLILIKDPRLTFFTDFLFDACKDLYNIYFIFLTRNKNECCTSLSKAQKLHIKDSELLFDITMLKYKETFLLIDHKDIIFNNNFVIQKISEFVNFNITNNTENIVDMKLYRNRT